MLRQRNHWGPFFIGLLIYIGAGLRADELEKEGLNFFTDPALLLGLVAFLLIVNHLEMSTKSQRS